MFRIHTVNFISALIGFSTVCTIAGAISVGAAPKGEVTTVASRIIKYNFPNCKRVTGAVRQNDGSIRAVCDSSKYLVFTVFNAKEGRTIELALNCTAAKKLDIAC